MFAGNWARHIPLNILSSRLQRKKTCIIQSLTHKNVRVEHTLTVVKFYINIILNRRVSHVKTRKINKCAKHIVYSF